MYHEASEAPALVDRQLRRNAGIVRDAARRLRALDPPFVATLARGSSDHAAGFAKVMIETRPRIPVLSHMPSIGSLYEATSAKFAGVPLIVISQSGRSPDILRAADAAKANGALIVAIVNDEASPLAGSADIVIPISVGTETSVAATKSFIASLSAIAQLTAAWAEDAALETALDNAGSLLDAAWQLDWQAALPPLVSARSLIVLGRGLTLPIAGEAALKLKETSALHAEAFSHAEVAHGPMTLVTAGSPVLVFAAPDIARTGLAERIADFVARGATVMAAGASTDTGNAQIVLPQISGAHPVMAAISQIQSFYQLADGLARARGRDPDAPPHLAKVTRTL